jgi:hypothetical protein
VKKNNLLQGAIVALLMAAPFAANADSQYPATDFEPKVLYQDESIKSSAPAVKAAPAAVASASAASSDDSQYPATNFQPKVLFQDENYKPSKSAPSIAPTSAPEFTTSAGAVIMEASKKEDGIDPNLFILAGLAAAAFGVSRCPKFAGIFGGNTAPAEVSANRETGVTRYLNARVPKVSGVTKYLERAGKPTNVARYIAKQNIAQKAAQNDADRG